jgi:predicted DNA-binding transcriptional regulator YafY
MLTELRRDCIVEQVEEDGAVTVRELCQRFDTTQQTISRDLVQLHAQGRLRRVRGGAVRARPMPAPERPAAPLAARQHLTEAVGWLDAGDPLRAATHATAAAAKLLDLSTQPPARHRTGTA